jgi:hypothetical protein
LTGTRTSSGACGSIRRYAKNLTRDRKRRAGPGETRGVSPPTGGAWLSSARVVRCWVKSQNERNPSPQLPSSGWELWGHCRRKPEEDGDDVKSARPLFPGPHTCYNGRHRGMRRGDPEQIPKAGLSSDRSLQLGSAKLELLVIADQHCCGEYVLGSCTHCPSHHESLQRLKPLSQPQGGRRQGRGR